LLRKSSTSADATEKIIGQEIPRPLTLRPTTTQEYCHAAGGRPNMKKKEDARLAILREYDRWAKDHPNDAKKMGGFVFFEYLEKERPNLLDFRAHGSKWQIVHLWLRHGGRFKD
jgi:hypothetical protein